jgi:hypothetical protein
MNLLPGPLCVPEIEVYASPNRSVINSWKLRSIYVDPHFAPVSRYVRDLLKQSMKNLDPPSTTQSSLKTSWGLTSSIPYAVMSTVPPPQSQLSMLSPAWQQSAHTVRYYSVHHLTLNLFSPPRLVLSIDSAAASGSDIILTTSCGLPCLRKPAFSAAFLVISRAPSL